MPTIITKRYYPSLSSIITIDDIPDSLGFLKDGIVNILEKIHFKDLQYSISSKGDAGFYSLSIVSKKRIEFEIPGTGIFLILNPELENVNISSFPISIDYNWKILGYIRDFDINNFTASPQEIFELTLRVLNVSEEQALAHFISVFVEPPSNNISFIEQFIIDLNNSEGLGLPMPNNRTTLTEIAEEIFLRSGGHFSSLIAFSTYILQNDIEETKIKLNTYFRKFLPEDPEEFIKDVILPKATINLALSAAIEFPRNILLPVDETTFEVIEELLDNGQPSGYPKTQFRFNESNFSINTEKGFDSSLDLALSSSSLSQIGTTGLMIDFEDIKIDLSENKNIEEADLDNRPNSFKGFFAKEVTIILPPILKNQGGEMIRIKGQDFLVGSEGGVSGIVYLDSTPLNANLSILELEFESLYFEFTKNAILNSNIQGKINIPGLVPDDGTSSIIFSLLIKEDGKHTASANLSGAFNTLGLPITLNEINIEFDHKKISKFEATGTISLPGLGQDEGNVGNEGYLIIDILLGIKAGQYQIKANAQDDLFLLGLPLWLDEIDITFGNNIFTSFDITGGIIIPGIKEDGTGSDAEFSFQLNIQQNKYKLSFNQSSGSLKLFGLPISFDDFDLSIVDNKISELITSGNILLDDIKDDNGNTAKLEFDLTLKPNDYQLQLKAVNQGLSLGGLPITLTSGQVTLSDSGLTSLQIEGKITLSPELGNGETDFSIKVDDAGVDITIIGIPNNMSLVIPSPILEPVPETNATESKIDYSISGLSYTSGSGIAVSGISFQGFTKSEVLKTGIIIEIPIPTQANPNEVQIDLSETHNLISKKEDLEKPFKGVYIQYAIIELPDWWKKDEDPKAKIVGKDLLFGKTNGENVIEANLSLEPIINERSLKTYLNVEKTTILTLSEFTVVIKDQKVDSSSIKATLQVPAFENPEDKIGIEMTMKSVVEGSESFYNYEVTANDFPTFKLGSVDIEILEVDLLMNRNGLQHVKINGDLKFKDGAEKVNVLIGVFGNDFYIRGTKTPGIELSLLEVILLNIRGIGFGKNEGKWFFELSADAALLVDIPMMNKIIPQKISVNPLVIGKPLLPDNTTSNAETELKMEWSDGLKIESESGSVSTKIRVGKKVLNFLIINEIGIELETFNETNKKGVGTAITLDGGIELGPITGIIEGIGLEIEATIDSSKNGNLGLLDLKPVFRPPTGISISIDSEGFSGGGYLSIDGNKYVGIVNLNFKNKINFTAIGIITTTLEDGEKGFSILLLITVEGISIQLGMGFMLTGIGGIIALNRSMNVDALRAGVKSGALTSLMFPQDPLTNFSVIISDLESFFPIQKKQFVFGPMVKIAWGGAKALLELELGLLIELPNPTRIAIPGVLRTLIPKRDSKLISVQVNFLGVIDFQKKSISFDASLFASRLTKFTMSGDMAFRLTWGKNPNFLFSIGGFHPAYDPPPLDLPAMDRLAISLLDTKKGKVRLETYFAITSNSVQLGARLEAKFKALKWNVVGMIYFDALFQFNPFSFIINAGAMFAVINKKGKEILAVSLDLSLSGPSPWNVKGLASFKIAGVKANVRFNKTFGERKSTTLPNITIWPLLETEFKKQENWKAVFPKNKNDLVKLKELKAPSFLVLHPVGSFTVSQGLLPLNVKIEKFGNQKPSSVQKYSIPSVEIESSLYSINNNQLVYVDGQFAPAQFQNLSDSQKLSTPSFKKYKNGVSVTATREFALGNAAKRIVEYETILQNNPDKLPSSPEDSTHFFHFIKSSAVSQTSMSYSKKEKVSQLDTKVKTMDETYVVVQKSDMSPINNGMEYNYGEAIDALNLHISSSSNQDDLEIEDFQIIPTFELEPSN
ncbi:MAG: DUF6603 domain-containing protein [Saprospiraceae bacterium]